MIPYGTIIINNMVLNNTTKIGRMYIKLELLKSDLYELISRKSDDFELDADEIANTTAIKALSEIQCILSDKNESDFEIVEKIICVFEKYKLDFGGQHVF